MTETIEPMPTQIDQQQLAQELVDRARAEGVDLIGPGGLLSGLTKTVLETALEAELSEHLGYDKHDPVGRNQGNSRNGTRTKTVVTEIGPVDIEVPRDREGSFDPVIVRKRQRRLEGIDAIVLSLTARGLTTGEIAAHFAEVYGATVSRDTISRITDKVVEQMTEWQHRPLDRVYPVIFIDAIVVKIRDGQVTNRPVYAAIGVTVNGERDILGLWAGDGGEGSGPRPRWVPMLDGLDLVLRWYLDDVRGRFPDSAVLLCDESGDRMAAATVRNRLRHLMGVEGRPEADWFSPHGMRRACATHNYERGVDLVAIQQLLGHWTVASTMRYVRPSETFIEDAYQRAISATLSELTGQK